MKGHKNTLKDHLVGLGPSRPGAQDTDQPSCSELRNPESQKFRESHNSQGLKSILGWLI